jgi:hypothetical protein
MRRIVSSLTAAILLFAAIAFSGSATANAAQAALCDPPHYFNGSNSTAMTLRSHNIKSAPYAACGNVAWIGEGMNIYIWCSRVNQYGNMWVYARVAGSSTRGWFSLDNIEILAGTTWPCGDGW